MRDATCTASGVCGTTSKRNLYAPRNKYYRFSEAPQMVFSYRWAISEPRRQNFLYFMPYSGVTGQVGQLQLFSSEIHIKLFPVAQKRSSLAFFAQVV
jgi:hypothetical protein